MTPMPEPSTPHPNAPLLDALESVLGAIDTQESAAAAVEAVCRALGYRPDGDGKEWPDA